MIFQEHQSPKPWEIASALRLQDNTESAHEIIRESWCFDEGKSERAKIAEGKKFFLKALNFVFLRNVEQV